MFAKRWQRTPKRGSANKRVEINTDNNLMEWFNKKPFEDSTLLFLIELDRFVEFCKDFRILRGYVRRSEEIYTFLENFRSYLKKFESGDISFEEMDSLASDEAENLEDLLDHVPNIFGIRTCEDKIEEFIEEFEEKIEKLYQPVRKSGYDIYHVLIRAV